MPKLNRILLCFVGLLLSACVKNQTADPLKTPEGRDKAVDAYIQLGLGYLKDGGTEQAKVPLRQALEINPNSAAAHASLAYVFQRELEPNLADQEYRKALVLAPKDPRFLNNYGSFLFDQGRYSEAEQYFLRASQDPLYPERSRVFENLGLTAVKLGKTAQAKQYLERSVRMNPDQPRALFELAQLFYKEGRYVQARSYYSQLEAMGNPTPQSLLLGLQLAQATQDAAAQTRYVQALTRLYPNSPEYRQYQSGRP